MRNQEENIYLQKKVRRRICERNITFLAARPPSYIIFVVFFVHSDFTKEKKIAPENAVGAVRNQEEKIGLQKKVHRRICVSDATFLAARPATYIIFVAFLSTTILHSKRKIVPENGERRGEGVVGSLLPSCV